MNFQLNMLVLKINSLVTFSLKKEDKDRTEDDIITLNQKKC